MTYPVMPACFCIGLMDLLSFCMFGNLSKHEDLGRAACSSHSLLAVRVA